MRLLAENTARSGDKSLHRIRWVVISVDFLVLSSWHDPCDSAAPPSRFIVPARVERRNSSAGVETANTMLQYRTVRFCQCGQAHCHRSCGQFAALITGLLGSNLQYDDNFAELGRKICKIRS